MAVPEMGLFKFLQYAFVLVTVMVNVQNSAESTVLIRFDRAPPARSRYSSAVFRYSVLTLNGSNACDKNTCSVHCQLDGQTLSPCPAKVMIFKNLTVNRDHIFLLNVKTWDGHRNSSAYSWFVDTIPPTATIFSEMNYTSAEKLAIGIMFNEACTGKGGFRCLNSSNCDVIVDGPGRVQPSSLRMIKPSISYSLDVVLSLASMYGRVVIRMADDFCTDQAGNSFTRTNGSTIIIHFDRRPVLADLWTSVPAYELMINGVPRTILATNKMEDLNIFLDFSIPIMNTTEQILNALVVNSGNLVPIHGRNQGNRRFKFQLRNISRTEIIKIELQAGLIIGRTGIPVSPIPSFTFLYDYMETSVGLSTSSPNVTKDRNINVIVEFTKPVFGFQASMVQVVGGRITRQNVKIFYFASCRFRELSRALYSLNVLAVTEHTVSVAVPSGKVYDISGNLNMASNQLEVKHYSTPAISIALHSFVTVGMLATSLAAAILSISTANLGAVGTLASESSNIVASDSMNLHGMVGHLQVFVLSDWLSVNQPIEYLETTKGLRWLIPRQKLPWKKDSTLVWPCQEKLERKLSISSVRGSPHEGTRIGVDFYLSNSSYMQHEVPVPIEVDPKPGWLHGQHSMRMTPYGLPLHSNEYFTYFLRGEPLSASNVIKGMGNYKGWEDLQMNLFWLCIGGGSLVITHVLILLFLRWRLGPPARGILSVPRFELFLLIVMLPCITQSSTFVMKGGTTGGIITGALLLAIPAALILSVCLFQIIAIFYGSFVQYKEVKHVARKEPWTEKLWYFLTGRPSAGKWFYKEGLPSSFLLRFGILFESFQGPPLFIFVDQNEPNSRSKWTGSGRSGIGRMRPVSLEDSTEEIKTPLSKRLLGCARSSYIIVDLSRRVCLGIISGAYSSRKSSQSLFALAITLVQFMYLFTLKPYIKRGVHMAECVSLLCEVGIFALLISINGSNPVKARNLGFVMLTLLFLTFVTQMINEWHALMKSLLRLSQPQKNSFKLGLKFAAKGLVLPFLPRKQWSRIIPASSQPKTGLAPVLPLSPDTNFERRDTRAPHTDPISAMTATVVPVISPGSPGLDVLQMTCSTNVEATVSTQRAAEAKRQKGLKLEPKSDLKKLRELARASFSGDSIFEEASTSYCSRMQPLSGEPSLQTPQASTSRTKH
ncbi:unnamed protein product [Prunus brigantina]